jgi:aromatic-L-amino-acid decarboxylase
LKFWFVVRAFGVAGIQARLREHILLAGRLAGWIDAHPDFERLAPTPFSTVCFRAHPKGVDEESVLDALNEQLMERVNATGRAFLSHTKLRDRFTIRWAIGNLRTDEARVEETWKILNDLLREIQM